MSAVKPLLSQNVSEHPKDAHSLPLLVFFVEAEERGCVSYTLSVCFSMTQCNKEKSPMKCPLKFAEDYNDK